MHSKDVLKDRRIIEQDKMHSFERRLTHINGITYGQKKASELCFPLIINHISRFCIEAQDIKTVFRN